MALSLTIFGLFLIIAILLYVGGLVFKLPYLFLFGCVMIFGTGALLWGFGGLITNYYYDVEGLLQTVVIGMDNLGMVMFSLLLVAIPIISFLVVDLSPRVSRQASPFHY
jgi:hypothetical protein